MFKKNYKNSYYKKDNYNNSNYNNDRRENNNFRPHRNNSDNEHNECGCNHQHSILEELFCHTPLAIFALSLSYIFFFLLNIFLSSNSSFDAYSVYDPLFHIVHYIHILCAIISSMIMFNKYSVKNKFIISFFSVINSIIFCTLSDIIFPTIAARFLNISIPIHICFFHYEDFFNLSLFAFLGIIGGISLLYGNKKQSNAIAKILHVGHIWFGCISALVYILAHTSIEWFVNSGSIICLLFVSVVIPCIISDVIIPIALSINFFSKNNIYKYKDPSMYNEK